MGYLAQTLPQPPPPGEQGLLVKCPETGQQKSGACSWPRVTAAERGQLVVMVITVDVVDDVALRVDKTLKASVSGWIPSP